MTNKAQISNVFDRTPDFQPLRMNFDKAKKPGQPGNQRFVERFVERFVVHSDVGDFPAQFSYSIASSSSCMFTRCISFAVMLRTDNECGHRLTWSLEVWP